MEQHQGRGELAIGIGVLALAGVILWQAGTIPSPPYAQMGPRVALYIIGGGLALLGAALAFTAATGRWRADADADAGSPDLRALAWLAGALVINILVIEKLGFIIASTIMFTLIARAFGSMKLLRDSAIGLAIALTAYLGFDKLLGIRIGAGILEGIL